MLAPSGEQFRIASHGYEAVITESGAALRTLTFEGRDLVDGFDEDAMSSGGRGQLLMPWPNRIRDGRYSFDGAAHQLALTEPARRNASHGLARWAAWTLAEHDEARVTLTYRVMAQTGYPWTLELAVSYSVGRFGLSVVQSAQNFSDTAAPYAQGAHPYITVGSGPIDNWTLQLPAATRLLTDDERLLPVGREHVEGTTYDFRAPRTVGDVYFNHCFAGLRRGEDPDVPDHATVRVSDGTHTTGLWVDETWPWLLLYSGDDTAAPRRSLAVEPMSAPVDAFSSGEDLIRLEPGETHSGVWGIFAE
ncbi:aldose 1-epimerase [Nocardioides baekrokdamisoli]|uniref:Aldose 1-epimerase n=1 Tax=Nocardioides baekrokdamisoli TaxID=1804624 RepID=A0A3G9J135_9ACTN|nr:aldose 1-epimerase family protein [Nocardioides baekrokdamisoli]BBH18353.1 aldose 1-epimerase [Nocardioides baekrokdamisoli]